MCAGRYAGDPALHAFGGVITPNTGDITTATVFDFTNFGTTVNQTGIFAGLPIQMFGPVTLDITTTGLSFSDSVFGDIKSTSVTPIFVGMNSATFRDTGLWTPGTFSGFSGLTGGPFTADHIYSFTPSPRSAGRALPPALAAPWPSAKSPSRGVLCSSSRVLSLES